MDKDEHDLVARRQEMLDFVANRTNPETTRRIVQELDDPDSFASRYIDDLRDRIEHLFERIDYDKLVAAEDEWDAEGEDESQQFPRPKPSSLLDIPAGHDTPPGWADPVAHYRATAMQAARRAAGYGFQTLTERVQRLRPGGWSLAPADLEAVESGQRLLDVFLIVPLADALDQSPDSLLFPPEGRSVEVFL